MSVINETLLYSVRAAGAAGDGKTLDTAAIQRAIEACALSGGGTVFFPAGRYLSGTVTLRSNVRLYLDGGAALLGSTDISHYTLGGEFPFPFSPVSWQALLYARDASNICVCGSGRIDGQGAAFPCGAEAYPADEEQSADSGEYLVRPSLFYFTGCRGVTLRDIHVKDAAMYSLLFNHCRDMTVDSIRVVNRAAQNNDGLHFVDCEHVRVTGCDLDCGDDTIVLNGGGQRFTIDGCILSSRWAAIRVGPFGRGTHPDATGVFRDIAVSNCVIHDTYGCGVKLQLVDGLVMENLVFTNLVMRHVTGPISIRLSQFKGWKNEIKNPLPPGVLRNVRFDNIEADVADNSHPLPHEVPSYPGERSSCISVVGIDGHCVENVSFSNMRVTFPGGGTAEEAARTDLPELNFKYPEYHMFGVLPAYGLYARHVRGLSFANVRFCLASPDARQAVVTDDVEEMDARLLNADGYKGG